MVHHTTKNISFLKLYKHLKDKGIKNNKFFLKLNNPDLLNVDPHSPTLTQLQKAQIAEEVMGNPWYFYREVVKIPVPGGVKDFELHRGNLAMLWTMHMNVKSCTVLPRQNYKTISTVVGLLWVYDFGTTNSQMIFSNKEFKDSKLNLKRFKDIRKLLPKWLVTRTPKEDSDNIESIVHAKRGNSILTLSAPMSEDAAEKMGRGMTVPIVWYDEYAFLKFNDTFYASAAPAQSQASIEAERNGRPFFTCITTTPKHYWAILMRIKMIISLIAGTSLWENQQRRLCY
jgi:hypothetical protein